MIKEQCYVAVVRSSKEFNAKPFLTGVVSLLGPDNLNFFQLQKAGTLNGVFVYFRTMVGNKTKGPGPKTLQEATEFYQETIDAVIYQYEKDHGPLGFKLATLPMLPILSGPEFIDHAISIGVMSAGTVAKCKLSSASLAPTLPPVSLGGGPAPVSGPSSATGLPSLPVGAASVSVVAPPQSGPAAAAATSAAGSSGRNIAPSPEENASSTDDPLQKAMIENNIEVAANEEVQDAFAGGEEGEDFQHARLMEVENAGQGLVVEEVLDFDRLAEDAVLDIQALPLAEQQHPVIKRLGDTVKRQQGKIKELQGIVHSYQQLTATQDLNLREFQVSSAENIVPGILPAVKQALGSIKTEVNQGFDEKVDNLLVAINEQGSAALASEVSSLRACLATTAGQVAEINHLVKSTMGAVILVDKNLSAVGLGSREANAPKIDIPAVLDGIENNLKTGQVSSSSPYGSSATVQSIEAFKPSRETAGPFLASGTPSYGAVNRKSSSSPASSDAPPRKVLRWDARPDGSSTPSVPPVSTLPPRATPRSLESELNSAGETPSSNPALYSAMVTAKSVCLTPVTKEQIDKRTKEMRSLLSARNRR